MAKLGQQFTFLRSPRDVGGQAAWARARAKQSELQEEGHASSLGLDRANGSVLLTVLPGRPDGWEDFHDDDIETSPAQRAHFGLNQKPRVVS